jgi:peptide-methionine (S)-S-oxide reductase
MTTRTRTDYRAMFAVSGAALVFSAVAALWPQRPASAEEMKLVPPPAVDAPMSHAKSATAVFAGGCFWGVQGVFQHVKGVQSAVSGYSGGAKTTASYPVVSSGTTGHAESVKITYDPGQISYGKLLQIYFSVVADPTQLNAQGPDEGTQYRSDIFATTPEQDKIAKDYVAQLQTSHVFGAPVVTKVSGFKAFYPAEGYHQNYLTLHPNDGYIAANDIPKVEGLKKLFPQDYQSSPVLVSTN